MQQYKKLLCNIIDNGVEKESGRANMPNTIGISFATMTFNLNEGFPLLTTKKMHLKGIIHELLWFLRGDTNIRYLVDNDVHIWDGDAYRWYLQKHKEFYKEMPIVAFTMEEFIEKVKSSAGEVHLAFSGGMDSMYVLGDLGKVYGYQWRNQNGIDQVKDVIEGLKSNPYSRYHIIDGWNKADFKEMALPPCHLLYQFIVRPLSLKERNELASKMSQRPNEVGHQAFDEFGVPKFYLDLNMYQRSCDTFLGVPYNIASMSLLLMIFAKASGMELGIANWIGGDTHLYVTHLEQVKLQLQREPKKLPTIKIIKDINSLKDITNLKYEDFELSNYEYHAAIKAELSVGLKK